MGDAARAVPGRLKLEEVSDVGPRTVGDESRAIGVRTLVGVDRRGDGGRALEGVRPLTLDGAAPERISAGDRARAERCVGDGARTDAVVVTVERAGLGSLRVALL